MILRVVFTSGETGLVQATDLDALIREEKIVAFCRSEGWVRIGFDQIRYLERPYAGPGRRWADLAQGRK
ncbi:hypothetical protein GMLC_31290 [Geomonas limicola]|uniref:Uncharacterized protein n=1 Tax=Geomonas limicola TaxID=2740186 RepID=A0A6V8NAS6_9BACT|nr:hypothetical protein [Geomonas limicola]GFO69550.1 hypothetical protein GMLC_31290 [Geomonas limicola]